MTLIERLVQLPAEALIRFLLGAYFRRIEVFHAERVPKGPVLFVANHPGSSRSNERDPWYLRAQKAALSGR